MICSLLLKMFATNYITSVLLVNSFIMQFQNPNCTHFLSLSGSDETRLELHRAEDLIQLVIHNTSYNVHLYTFISNGTFSFEWPSKSIDGISMKLVHNMGTFHQLSFDKLSIHCDVTHFQGGHYLEYTEEDAYQCNHTSSNNIILYCIPVIVIFTLIAGGKMPAFVKFFMTKYNLVLNGRQTVARQETTI